MVIPSPPEANDIEVKLWLTTSCCEEKYSLLQVHELIFDYENDKP
jgi:hypothetical protein